MAPRNEIVSASLLQRVSPLYSTFQPYICSTTVKANPEEGLDAMAKAHSALVTYAKSGQKVNDLASLVEAMEAFATRAANIGRAIQDLHAS